MSKIQDKVTVFLSLAFRAAAYVFLRWVPGDPFPPLIYSLFALYIPSYIYSFISHQSHKVTETTTQSTLIAEESEDEPQTYASVTSNSVHPRRKTKPKAKKVSVAYSEKHCLYYAEERPFWKTILTGLPNPTSLRESILSLLINVALLAGVTDFVYRAPLYYPSNDVSFARIGYVGLDNAKLVIREPDQSKLPITVNLRLKDPVPPFDVTRDLYNGGIRYVTEDTDYTAVIPLQWSPQTEEREYIWTTSNNHSGVFTTPPKPGKSTDRNDGKYTFLTTSCIIPHFPYNPLHHPLHIPGLNARAVVVE